MTTTPTFVIVGGGLAGAKAAEALRAEGFDGHLVLVGAEPHRPYERPPLSKEYLQGAAGEDKLFVHPAEWYTDQRVDLRVGTTVTGIDRPAHRLLTGDGDRLRYDRLLLATGSSPRRLGVPGADLDGVRYLRSLDDSDRLRAAFVPGARVVVIGAGWIGLETAAAARAAGCEVTVLERAELPLLNVLGPQVARVFADLHRRHGVDLRCGVSVADLFPAADTRSVGGVRLGDGSRIGSDVVVVGVGVTPNADLARAGGLTVDDGVTVDAALRSSDPDIFAAGDVANAYHPFLGRHVRVEHWATALHQPAVAAKAMLGQSATYDRLPYFFTDQYDLGMEYTGYVAPGDHDEVVVRGDVDGLEFVAFWLRDSHVLAGMNVNVWDAKGPVTQLIRSRVRVDTARLADVDVPLDELTGGQLG
ncbi:MAG: NAD(P)/FAD-dependent oxidoreductase [Actinomycetes bacterium]